MGLQAVIREVAGFLIDFHNGTADLKAFRLVGYEQAGVARLAFTSSVTLIPLHGEVRAFLQRAL